MASFQKLNGGNNQGTIALVKAGNGKYYMIEQQTNNLVKAAAEALGIEYVNQGRLTGYHAEVRSIDWITENEIEFEDSEIWVSKPICADCGDALTAKGVTIHTTVNSVRYRNWIAPTGQSRALVGGNSTFIGRRSETERLQVWDMKK